MSTLEEPLDELADETTEPQTEEYYGGYGRVLIIVASGTIVSKPDYVDLVELDSPAMIPIVVRR